MKRFNIVAAACLAATGLVGGSANAEVLLSLINSAPGSTEYDLSFLATDTTSSIYVGGYQQPSSEIVTASVVSGGGSSQLLGGSWDFMPAPIGSDSGAFSFGAVPAIYFAGVSPGSYDSYSQSFATVVGAIYTYSFNFRQWAPGPSGLEVSTTPITSGAVTAGVPEPASWVIMLTGLAGLGAMLRRRRVEVLA